MNVLFLSELFYPSGSGGELATYLYAKLLSEAGFTIVVVTNRSHGDPEMSRHGNLTIVRVRLFDSAASVRYSTLSRLDVVCSSLLRKLIKWADLVYVPKFWYSAIPVARAYKKPVVTHLHGYGLICPLHSDLTISKNPVSWQVTGGSRAELCTKNHLCSTRCLYISERMSGRSLGESVLSAGLNFTVGRWIAKLAAMSDAIVCVSSAQRKIIADQMPCLNHKMSVIYNPLPEIDPIGTDGVDFGYFGGPSYLKGYAILLAALLRVRQAGRRRPTVYTTQFPKHDRRIVELLTGLGLSLHERLEKKDYERIYRQICTVIVPSVWPEPWPYVVSEALLNERLLIASRIGGITEQTEGLEGVFLFDVGDPMELAELIEYVHGLPKDNRRELGTKNREGFLRKFENRDTVRSMIDLFNRLA